MDYVEFDLNRNQFTYQNKNYDSFYEFENKIEDEDIEIFWSTSQRKSLSLIKKDFFSYMIKSTK